LTTLSVVDKYRLERESSALQRLLDLDGEIMEQGKGFWVEIHAKRVPPSTVKPHGIDYCLCLLNPSGKRLVCFDNAHPVSVGRPPSRKMSKTNDHQHVRRSVTPYAYTDAETLMGDFWAEVDKVSKAEGVQP
jgi:Family of unknown function (DUF6516)